ncbi:TVG1120468 [Thermoplasma volcanium GSS1]|uniref:TVG1120468 protein n=1 Tax=Thermoplasma volcanium (strain ATCC 51530 / DSM 4299 / JCM 9571 / NBRC 15438 / GSS1) TaxID=273116 RepID=Q979S0_THEVO|nr:TVG1120468 [Thermoplasma volcanium GSS1]
MIISATIYNIFESIILGYKYYIIFSFILFFVFTSDILIFNLSSRRYLPNVEVDLRVGSEKVRKYSKHNVFVSFLNKNNGVVSFHYYVYTSDTFKLTGDYENFLTLGPYERVEKSFVIEPTTIGNYVLGPVSIYTEDGMKLAIERLEVSKSVDLKVAPSLSETMAARSERLSNMLYYTGVHYNKKAGEGYDFLSLREYYPGDEIRYVAWSRFGRTRGDDLYVKQMEEERIIDVLFVVDYGIGMNHGHDGIRMFDTVISDVLKTSYKIRKNQDGVGFMISSSAFEYYIKPSRTARPVEDLEKVVSGIRPAGKFDFVNIVQDTKKKVKKSTLIMIISSFSSTDNIMRGLEDLKGYKAMFFVLNPYEFIVDGTENMTLRYTLFTRQYAISKAIASVIKSRGFRSDVCGRKDLYRKLVSAYIYAKMTNMGE